jgi:hypothetical protein
MSQLITDAFDFWIPSNFLGYSNLNEGVVGFLGYVQFHPPPRQREADLFTVLPLRTWLSRSAGARLALPPSRVLPPHTGQKRQDTSCWPLYPLSVTSVRTICHDPIVVTILPTLLALLWGIPPLATGHWLDTGAGRGRRGRDGKARSSCSRQAAHLQNRPAMSVSRMPPGASTRRAIERRAPSAEFSWPGAVFGRVPKFCNVIHQ